MKCANVLILVVSLALTSAVDAGLVQHWTLDDSAGTFTEGLGYTVMPIANEVAGGSQAMIVSPETQQSEALFGQAGASSLTGTSITLNGRHDGIELGDVAPGTGEFTIAFWFNTNGMQCFNDSADRLISANRGQAGRWEVALVGTAGQTEDMTVNFYHADGASYNIVDAVDAGQWYHVAMTRSNDTEDNYKLYLNGVEKAVLTDTTAFTCTADANGAVRMGHKLSNTTSGVSRGYNGGYDDIRFYDTALTAAEISALAVPEPATMVLLGCGFLIRLRRRS